MLLKVTAASYERQLAKRSRAHLFTTRKRAEVLPDGICALSKESMPAAPRPILAALISYYLWDIDGPLYGWYQDGSGSINAHATPLDILLETAGNMGFLPEDILLMLEGGYCEEEIESLLNTPGAFYTTPSAPHRMRRVYSVVSRIFRKMVFRFWHE